MIYERVADLDFALADLPKMPRPEHVLLTTPAHFEISYVINPHMAGHIGTVDLEEAQGAWQSLRDAYSMIGITPDVVEGAPDQPDMVFCANQTLPFVRPGTQERGILLSCMFAPQRRGEVPHYARHFADRGYAVEELVDDGSGLCFEGMGDAIWHPGRYLLWGGYGFRTQRRAYKQITERLGVRVLLLHLEDPDFYHLDTCLSVLDEETALYFPGAFTGDGTALLRHVFPRLIEAPEDEARSLFACNAHCPDEKHVLIQRGCDVTSARLREHGFVPVEIDTTEFIKAGGSVFCMKLMHW